MSVDELLAMARAAGLCYPDCHFLDLDPYEDLLQTLAGCNSEEEREAYLAIVRREDSNRRERLHELERFAAAVLRHAAADLQKSTQHWSDENFDVWVGATRACTRLEFQALELEERHTPLPQGLV